MGCGCGDKSRKNHAAASPEELVAAANARQERDDSHAKQTANTQRTALENARTR